MAPSPIVVRARRPFAAAAVLAVFTALALLLSAPSPPASAAPITVPDCPGMSAPWLPPANATTLTDAQQAQIRSGNSIIIYDNYGSTIESLIAAGDDPLLDPYPPACVARSSGGQIVTEWAFCTDRTHHVCLDQLLPTVTGNPRLAPSVDPLGPDKERVIAYLAQHGYPVRDDSADQMSGGVHFADSSSTDSRTSLQQLIWCVSEAAPGEKTLTVNGPNDRLGTETCPKNFNDADFDAVLALQPAAPTLSVAPQSSGPLTAGQPARFVVTTNVLGIPITLSGASGLTVCDGSATLRGDQLTVPGNDGFETKQVTLCTPGGTAGSTATIALSVQHPSPNSISWSWGGSTSCQVFATFHEEPPTVRAASASTRFMAAPTPVTPTPVTPTPEPRTAQPVERSRARGQMRLTKTSNRARAKTGQRITYKIRVRNSGRIALRNVRVCDTLPAGLTRVRTSKRPKVSRGRTCWTVKRLAAGRSATFTLTARVAGGARPRLTNKATATSRDAPTRTARRTIRVVTAKAKAGGVTG